MKSQIRSLWMLIIPLALLLALAACGGATQITSSTEAAPSTNAQAAPTAALQATAAIAAPQATGPSAAAPQATDASAAPAATAAGSATTAAKLNLNDVTAEQLLATIPNLGNRMVNEFFEYRPYVSIQQFRREIGKYVDAEQVGAYEQYVYVPVDVNQADAATLQQLPGVDASVADALIAGRPYASNQAFLDKLGGLTSSADAQQAAAYLSAN